MLGSQHIKPVNQVWARVKKLGQKDYLSALGEL
jgi:hypothetical protein